MSTSQTPFEKNIGLMGLFVVIVVSFGGLAEIVPLMFQGDMTTPVEGVKPLEALALEGRDIYIRDGCTVCHTQMVRPLRSETERYGHYSVAGESVYEHPFLWGSKRTGPDLARVGGRYSDEWHRMHLHNPRDVVPESNMPAFKWLERNILSGDETATKMRALRVVGVPYTDQQIEAAKVAVEGKTEQDAVVAYLQQLGLAMKGKR
jgi:cytochrome c oxidase cbb3-type subunit 2